MGLGAPCRSRSWLALAERDPSPFGVVRRDLYGDAVAGNDADEVLAHPSGHVRHDLVTHIELDDELRVRQGFRDHALHRYAFFFRHNSPENRVTGRDLGRGPIEP